MKSNYSSKSPAAGRRSSNRSSLKSGGRQKSQRGQKSSIATFENKVYCTAYQIDRVRRPQANNMTIHHKEADSTIEHHLGSITSTQSQKRAAFNRAPMAVSKVSSSSIIYLFISNRSNHALLLLEGKEGPPDNSASFQFRLKLLRGIFSGIGDF